MKPTGKFRPELLAILVLLAASATLLAAQPPAPAASAPPPAATPAASATAAASATPTSTAPTINVDARLVNIPVVVRDKKGALVQNLTKDNFVLQVDSHPQTIRYFNIDKDLPLTLGLLVDTSMSQRDVLDEERTASSAFLDDMLIKPADKAFIVQFAHQTDLLRDGSPETQGPSSRHVEAPRLAQLPRQQLRQQLRQ